jgi:nicotinamide-nucleotide amidase
MKAEIISIGTELLLGTIVDTNAAYLAQRLAQLGIDCYHISQVGDNQARIVDALGTAVARSDLTITTGGLGPTGDDLTRESIAAFLKETPRVVPALEERLRAFFARRGVAMPERNVKQATVIPSARILDNPVGTAPGWLVSTVASDVTHYIVSMPGVPFEMKRMWEHEVEPWLRPMSPFTLVSRTLKTTGLGESAVDQMVTDLTEGANPTVAPYAKADGVHLRISAKAASTEEALALIAPVEHELRRRLGDAIYGADDDTPAEVVKGLLDEAGLRLAVIEIGRGAMGAVSAPLSRCGGTVLAVTCASLEEAAQLLNASEPESELGKLGSILRERCGADLALAVRVEEQPASGNSVQAEAEVVLIAAESMRGEQERPLKSHWTTSDSEVSRLVGLAALNVLRKWLLKNDRIVESLPHAG